MTQAAEELSSQPLNVAAGNFSSTRSLQVLVQALQECSEKLHLGPHGLLSVSFGVNGELQLLRPRAGDALQQGKAELAEWRVLWGAFLGNAPTLATGDKVRRKQLLVDGHGRLLLTCASLLRQLLLPEAQYPLVDTPSSSRNRLRLVRMLRKLTTPGELQKIPLTDVGEGGEKNRGMEGSHEDPIGRVAHACLRIVQPRSLSASLTMTRRVLEGCIHFNMCTEVEDDVLKTIRGMLLRFLWNSQRPKGSVATLSIVDRARGLLKDPASCIVSCVGESVLSSRNLPSHTLLFPTIAGSLSVHHGTETPLFALERDSSKQCHWVLLLRIDIKGGLLDFTHSRVLQSDAESGSDNDMDESVECQRDVQRPWTAAEQDEAQCEAARALYEWAWAHAVDVILTPSHAPPVIKTYGVRYSNVDNTSTADTSSGGFRKRGPIIMVDEVEEVVFDAMLRRLQRWYHEGHSDMKSEGDVLVCPPFAPAPAVLRRGRLVLPERPRDALVSCARVVHSPLCGLLTSAARSTMTTERSGHARVVLLELDHGVALEAHMGRMRDAKSASLMVLVGPTSKQLSVNRALILKCASALLTAVDASSAQEAGPECGLGFVRAGGALQIAMARQMRQRAEALKRMMHGGTDGTFVAEEVPILSAVLHVLSEALLEVPRRLASYLTAHHYPLRRAWLCLEGEEMRREQSHLLQSLTPALSRPPLHVCLRDSPKWAYFRDVEPSPPTTTSGVDHHRRYFCCSDTESNESESDEEGGESNRPEEEEEEEDDTVMSFVEPIATTTGVIRCAITLVRLVLSSKTPSGTAADVGVPAPHSPFHCR